jgi:uncharacterized peroxidase-related enzyme
MTFIETIPEDQASGLLAQMYEEERAADGYVWNNTQAFSHRPEVLGAWGRFLSTISTNMDRRRYELATLAAARRLRSSYCMLAHGSVLLDGLMGAEEVRAAATDHRSAGLEPVDVAVMDLADKVAGDATAIAQDDIDAARAAGLTDTEILDVVLAAAARCFMSKAIDALGTLPDHAYAERLEPDLREALTVGRPIAEV